MVEILSVALVRSVVDKDTPPFPLRASFLVPILFIPPVTQFSLHSSFYPLLFVFPTLFLFFFLLILALLILGYS